MTNYAKVIINDTVLELTPELLAIELMGMDSDEQAKFFSAAASVAATWTGGTVELQLIYVAESEYLSEEGKDLMISIGEAARVLSS